MTDDHPDLVQETVNSSPPSWMVATIVALAVMIIGSLPQLAMWAADLMPEMPALHGFYEHKALWWIISFVLVLGAARFYKKFQGRKAAIRLFSTSEQRSGSEYIDALDDRILICDGLNIVLGNAAFLSWSSMSKEIVAEQLITAFIRDPDLVNTLMSADETMIETDFIIGEQTCPVEITARTMKNNSKVLRLLNIKDISARIALEDRLHQLESHDPVTNLANSGCLKGQLASGIQRAARLGKACALIRISLDQTEQLFSSTDRSMREMILRSLARRLEMDVPPNALVAQIDTAEFAVFCKDMSDALESRLLGQHLKRLTNRPLDVGENKIEISASLGVATFPKDASSAEELMKHAALALISARLEGGGRLHSYSPKLGQAHQRHEKLSHDIRDALVNGDIHPYFQPVYSARTRTVSAFEALVRWKHKDFGLISPMEFLKIAEDNHLMVDLTESILRASLQVAQYWPPHVRICVNVSPAQLNSTMIDRIGEMLKEENFNPARLEIEVTEDVLIHDFEHAASMFSRLRALGVQVAMDDFGAGYTSLANLRYLHFDRIKIDRVFTMNLPGHRRVEAVVRAMMVLARELDIVVTVEGVETEEQFAFLEQEGCDEIQGFLFSPAKPAHELASFFLPKQAEPKLPESRLVVVEGGKRAAG
jgi:diguanylate cyclase (GGDEF)-like protein